MCHSHKLLFLYVFVCFLTISLYKYWPELATQSCKTLWHYFYCYTVQICILFMKISNIELSVTSKTSKPKTVLLVFRVAVFKCAQFYVSCMYLWNKLINQCFISRALALSVHCHLQELHPATTQTDSRKMINNRRAVVSFAVPQMGCFIYKP